MLDKNHKQRIYKDMTETQMRFEQNSLNIILCSNPFHRIEFLDRLINSTKDPVVFVDMDLLYTGYVRSGMIQKKENLEIVVNPTRANWEDNLSKIVCRASEERILIIIDSFNGMYNTFEGLESGRFINSCMMLLSSVANQSKSSTMVITGVARKKDDGRWILFPGGKRIIQSEKTGVYFLKRGTDGLVVTADD